MNSNTTMKTIVASLLLLGSVAKSQTISANLTLSPSQTQSFGLEKSNMTLNPVTYYNTSSNEAYHYAGGPGSNYNFLMNYNSYKYDHTGIANSDITNVSYSFSYNAHYDINFPTNPGYWAYSDMYVVSPQEPCNWSTSSLSDCVSREACIKSGYYLAYITPGGQPSNVALNLSQNINASSNPNLNVLLQNSNDFTISFMPDGNTSCYLDVTTPSVVITYNTYPIANNNIYGDQTFTGSGNPTVLGATTPTGGNRNIYSYQWQSSPDNFTWTNISGATLATYDPPTLTQTTYYRRIVNSSPQSPSTSNVVTITINVTNYPLTPTGLTAVGASPSSIYLSWNASLNSTSYDIYTCSGTFVATISGLAYTHTGLSPATTYSYKIYGRNVYGLSPASACVNGTTQALTPPVPTGFNVSVLSSRALHLSWNGMPNTTSYDVEVWDYNGNRLLQKNVTATSCVAFGLSQSSNYRCYVSGNNSYGSSAQAMVGPRTTGALANDPSWFFNVVSTSEESNLLTMSWGTQSNTTRYSIYKCDGTFIGDSYTPSFTHTGLTPNTVYDYYIVAVNLSSSSYRSSGYCFSFATRRSAPSGFTGVPLNCSQLKLSWNAYPGSPTYYLYDCSGTYLGSTVNTDYITSVTIGNSYSYQVMAANSSWSNVQATAKSICAHYNPSVYSAYLAASSSQICPGIPTSYLTITNCNSAATSIQWQSSVCGSSFQDIPGATSSPYAVNSAASTGTTFRAKLTSGSTIYYTNTQKISSYNVCNPTSIPACGGGGGQSRMAQTGENPENGYKEVEIYPNPASNNLTIGFYNSMETQLNVTIFDAQGKKVYEISEEVPTGDYKNTIDVSAFAHGIYYVKVDYAGYHQSTKIIKE